MVKKVICLSSFDYLLYQERLIWEERLKNCSSPV